MSKTTQDNSVSAGTADSVWNQPVDLNVWPLADVLKKLADWCQHFMTVHNCDCHGYEELSFVIPAARQHAALGSPGYIAGWDEQVARGIVAVAANRYENTIREQREIIKEWQRHIDRVAKILGCLGSTDAVEDAIAALVRPVSAVPETQELLPCPFCGGEPHERMSREQGALPLYWIECYLCEIGTKYHDSPTKARATWNTRTQPVPKEDRNGTTN